MNDPQPRFKVLLCTTSSVDEASNIAEHLVGNHVAACVNIIPGIRSVFWWNNKVYRDNEVLMVIKTEERLIPEVERAIRLLHSYETPELISLNVEHCLPEYGKWMLQSLAGKDES